MNKIWIIGKRELKTYFDSLVAYILIIVFLGISGLWTWLVLADVFFRGQANMDIFFTISQWALFLLIPGITMKMFAEENKTGTIEILLTKAVTDWQVVLGKFLGSFLLFLITLSFTLPYYFTIVGLFRYRFSIEPLLIVFAGYTIYWCAHRIGTALYAYGSIVTKEKRSLIGVPIQSGESVHILPEHVVPPRMD